MNGCGWVVLEEGGGGVNKAKNWLQRPVMALTVLPSEWSMSTVKYYTNTNRLLLTGMLWLWFGRFGKNGSTRIRQQQSSNVNLARRKTGSSDNYEIGRARITRRENQHAFRVLSLSLALSLSLHFLSTFRLLNTKAFILHYFPRSQLRDNLLWFFNSENGLRSIQIQCHACRRASYQKVITVMLMINEMVITNRKMALTIPRFYHTHRHTLILRLLWVNVVHQHLATSRYSFTYASKIRALF